AVKALELGAGPLQAIILGAITGVGGGRLRDVLIRRVPAVRSRGLYAIPALVAAALVTVGTGSGVDEVPGWSGAFGAAAVCFAVRMVGLHFARTAPGPSGAGRAEDRPVRAAGGRSEHAG